MSNFGANSTFGDKSNSGVNSLDSSNQFGRVYSILLTDDEKDASVMKVPPGSIGAIQFKFLVKGVEDNNPITQTAYPLDPRSRSFPVKNEVVEIISGPSNRVQDAESNNSQVYYYKSVVDMWGSAEHNARPNSRFDTDKSQVTGEFVEKGDISRMKHLPGDYVIEGRFGNGVRFGSSSSKTKVSSPWSGPDGSPLVIISNGRRKGKLSFEDINKDGSSMYMLSDQKLSFEPASLNFESYNVTMTAVQSAQVVKPDPVKAAETVPVQAVPATEPPTLPVVVDVPTKKEELKVDEVEALPEKEEPQDFQEYEEVGAMHLSSEEDYWREALMTTPTTNFVGESYTGGLSNLLLAYLGFQQGEAGLSAILSAANKGLATVPRNNGYTKEDVPYHMSRNVGRDFGSVPLTPANFLKYWKIKMDQKSKESLNKPIPAQVSSAIKEFSLKWGVPEDVARTMCYIESTYSPTSGKGKSAKESYIGLFQVSRELWSKRYPNESADNRIDPRKNADVGIKYISTMLANVPEFKRIIGQ